MALVITKEWKPHIFCENYVNHDYILFKSAHLHLFLFIRMTFWRRNVIELHSQQLRNPHTNVTIFPRLWAETKRSQKRYLGT